MRLHSDTITSDTVFDTVRRLREEGRITGVYATTAMGGSRSRRHGLTLKVTADPRKGRRRFTNSGYAGADTDDYAATWDEWGIILGALYDLDPNMTGDYYADREHYHWATGGRFEDGGPATTHDNHRWEYQGEAVTTYSVHRCKCGALKRWVSKPKFPQVFDRQWGERIEVPA